MEILEFRNIYSDARQKNIESLVYKQLAFGRYDISDDTCKVTVEITTGEFRKVQIDKNITRGIISKRIDADLLKEPAIKLFDRALFYGLDKDSTGKQSLIIFLNQYKEKYLKKGRDIDRLYFCKLHSLNPDKLNNPLRGRYGAKFLDYKRQLANSFFKKTIHNENGLNGIWATNLNTLLHVDNPNQLYENYGNHLFILRPHKNCSYFYFSLDGKIEIIGDKFIVVKQIELPEDVSKWKEILSELKDKYER